MVIAFTTLNYKKSSFLVTFLCRTYFPFSVPYTTHQSFPRPTTTYTRNISTPSPNNPLPSNLPLPSHSQPPPPPPPLRSRRTINRPSHLSYYICPTLPNLPTASSPRPITSSGTAHPLANFISYTKFSLSHCAFLFVLSNSVDPSSYSQALKHLHWCDAM